MFKLFFRIVCKLIIYIINILKKGAVSYLLYIFLKCLYIFNSNTILFEYAVIPLSTIYTVKDSLAVNSYKSLQYFCRGIFRLNDKKW